MAVTDVVVVPGDDGGADAAVAVAAGAAAVTAEHAEETADAAAETAADAAATAEVAAGVAFDAAAAVGELRTVVEDGFAELRGLIADSRVEAQVAAEEAAIAEVDLAADDLTPPEPDPEPERPKPAPPKKKSFGSDTWFGNR